MNIEDLAPYIDRCKDVLDAKKSGILGDRNAESVGLSLNKEGSIRRMWQDLSSRDVYIYKQFLDYYTDASNCGDGGGPAVNYVVDPYVGDATNGKIQAFGKYRNAFTIVRAMADDKYMLIQELRSGYIESLVSDGVVDYSEARVESIDWYNPDGVTPNQDYITLAWKGVSPNDVEAIAESLKNLPAEDWSPSVNGNALGSHHRLMVRTAEENDGSATVRVMLANSRLKFKAYGSWFTERQTEVVYHFNVPTDMVQALVDLERVNGASARIGAPDQRGLHDVTIEFPDPEVYIKLSDIVLQNCSTTGFMDMYLGLTKAESDAINLPARSAVPDGVTFRLRRQSRGDGLWDVTVEKTVREYQLLDEYSSKASEFSTEKTKIQLGVTTQPIPPVVKTVGKITRQSTELNEDCSKNVRTQTDEANTIADAGKSFTSSPLVSAIEETQRNAASQLGQPFTEKGKIKQVSSAINDFGRYDTQSSVRNAVKISGTAISGSALVSITETFGRNEDSPKSPGSGDVGFVNETSNSINEFGLYDTRQSVRKAFPISNNAESGSPLVLITETFGRNEETPKSSGAGIKGTVNEVSNSINEFGLYDTREAVRKAIFISNEAESGSPLVKIKEIFSRNKDEPVSRGQGGSGFINEVSNNINEFGLYDVRDSVREAVPFFDEAESGSVLVKIKEKFGRNEESPKSPGQGSVGIINEASNSINEFGRFDTRESVREAVAIFNESESGSVLVKIKEKFGRNEENPRSPGQGAVGFINEVSNSINEFGRFDTRESIREAVNVFNESESGSPLVVIKEKFGRNEESPKSPGAGDVGTVNEASNSINEFGRFDTREVNRDAKPALHTYDFGGKGSSGTLIVFRNQISVPASPSDFDRVSASVSINEFGLYDGVLTGASSDSGSGGVDDSGDFKNYSYKIKLDNPTAEYQISVRYTSFLSRAQEFVDGVTMATRTSLPTPGVFYAGKNKFRAVKVVQLTGEGFT
jgi:hypothetical protein